MRQGAGSVLACAASRRSWAPAATRSKPRARCCCARPMPSPTIRWSSSTRADTAEVLSGGNFHAEPVAFAADNLALAVAEIGALSERRIALLIDATLSGLPPFLVRDGGVNSGFMIAHVTAAALASENKLLAHPASVDSLPTSANQEDHVSMATFAARKLGDLCRKHGDHPRHRTAGRGAGRGPARAASHLGKTAARDARDPRARAALRHRPLPRAGHRRHGRRRQRRRDRRARTAGPGDRFPVEFVLFGADVARRGRVSPAHAHGRAARPRGDHGLQDLLRRLLRCSPGCSACGFTCSKSGWSSPTCSRCWWASRCCRGISKRATCRT